jgi:hypothetical protein
MSYIIRKTNDTTLGTILDGTIDDRSKTSLQLIGRNYSNYGQLMVDNLVRLVENFANATGPVNPLAGQIWYDTAQARIKVYTGTTYKIIATCAVQSVAPTTTVQGDMWYDNAEEQFFIYARSSVAYDPTGWVLIGPPFKKSKGRSGAIWEQILDNQSPTPVLHDVVSLYLNGNRTAIISTDPEFIPQTNINGFITVKRGLTANVNVNSGQYFVTANNANYLGSVFATDYLRSDIDDVTSGTLTITNNGGLTIGASSNLQVVTTTSGDAHIRNNRASGDIILYTNTGGVSTTAVTVDGATAKSFVREINVTQSTAATSTTTGALTVNGGVGIGGSLHVAGNIVAGTLLGNALGTATTITDILPVTLGGTNANNAANARANLGVAVNIDVQQFSVNLLAISNLGANGIITRTSNGDAAARAIVAGNNITVTNGDGIAGNPVVAIATSPALMGTPTSTTPPPGDNSTRIATTAFVQELFGANQVYWAGTSTMLQVMATYRNFPAGTKVAFNDNTAYSFGTGNGGAISFNDRYRRVVRKNSSSSNSSWSDVGA